MNISTRRIYEPAKPTDGTRILVDRIWPRGISREQACIDYWARDCAPSTELRKWYAHDPQKWQQFRERYFRVLDAAPVAVQELRRQLQGSRVTLLFASKEENLNNARALAEYLLPR